MPDTITTYACGLKDAAGKTWLIDRYHRTAAEARRTAQRYLDDLVASQPREYADSGRAVDHTIEVWPETRPVSR